MQERRARVFLVATANSVEELPPEMMRKGRVDEVFFVDLPGEAARREIFRLHLAKRREEAARFDLDALAAAAEGFSGAEIEQVIVSALYEARSARAAPGRFRHSRGAALDAAALGRPLGEGLRVKGVGRRQMRPGGLRAATRAAPTAPSETGRRGGRSPYRVML